MSPKNGPKITTQRRNGLTRYEDTEHIQKCAFYIQETNEYSNIEIYNQGNVLDDDAYDSLYDTCATKAVVQSYCMKHSPFVYNNQPQYIEYKEEERKVTITYDGNNCILRPLLNLVREIILLNGFSTLRYDDVMKDLIAGINASGLVLVAPNKLEIPIPEVISSTGHIV